MGRYTGRSTGVVARGPGAAEAFAFVGVAGLAVAAALSADHIDDGPIICPFRRLTGLPCPGCGLTRSFVYLMHGRVVDAFTVNAFGPVLVLAVAVFVVAVILARVRRRPALDLDRVLGNRWVIAGLLAWAGFGVVRMAWVGLT